MYRSNQGIIKNRISYEYSDNEKVSKICRDVYQLFVDNIGNREFEDQEEAFDELKNFLNNSKFLIGTNLNCNLAVFKIKECEIV